MHTFHNGFIAKMFAFHLFSFFSSVRKPTTSEKLAKHIIGTNPSRIWQAHNPKTGVSNDAMLEIIWVG